MGNETASPLPYDSVIRAKKLPWSGFFFHCCGLGFNSYAIPDNQSHTLPLLHVENCLNVSNYTVSVAPIGYPRRKRELLTEVRSLHLNSRVQCQPMAQRKASYAASLRGEKNSYVPSPTLCSVPNGTQRPRRNLLDGVSPSHLGLAI